MNDETFTGKIFVLSAFLLFSAIGTGFAQDTTATEIARQEAGLEKKRPDLEKKSLELQEKERARKSQNGIATAAGRPVAQRREPTR